MGGCLENPALSAIHFGSESAPMSNLTGSEMPGDPLLSMNAVIPPTSAESTAVPDAGPTAEPWMSELTTLLGELEVICQSRRRLPPVLSPTRDNQLVQVRLGIASSLFTALQYKHAATAGHSLRVALTVSAWALRAGLPDRERDAIEVAALLHDVGIMGVPDHILLKPALLAPDEMEVVIRARKASAAILAPSCASPEVLMIVENVSAWYDGTREGFSLKGGALPLGSRMIAIVEAFDAMTTEHVYRPARSHERAMAELFECAGVQFDPQLVPQFADFLTGDVSTIQHEAATRWLSELDPELVNSYWHWNAVPSPPTHQGNLEIRELFEQKLLENMYDAVVFVDAVARITLWNRGAERLTGMAGTSVRGHLWQPELLRLADEKGLPVHENDCPVLTALRSGVQSLRRLTIEGRAGRQVAVDAHTIPVAGDGGTMTGVILLFHDASSETSLEQRCLSLYEKATKDPLTQVANRAEFDRVHETFIAAHQQQNVPCSLIICDMDRFKQVNDTYGHQAGDDAIKTLAALLKNSCRPGDLVARYGGEEFVMLCANCDNPAATRRAEAIRKTLNQTPQDRMNSRPVSASFGVTEIQPGDTAETMLRRADRALLIAKAQGRNCVVQLGSGSDKDASEDKLRIPSRSSSKSHELLHKTLISAVPVKLAIEKLRGFVADHQAEIVSINGNRIVLEITDRHPRYLRRLSDRPMTFILDLVFEEERSKSNPPNQAPTACPVRTKIQILISLQRTRNRRYQDILRRAQQMLISFRAYLMAVDEEENPPEESAFVRVSRILAPWLIKRKG
jgi:diguanylate cyclase (GGDEF)-like protein/PAS domain S-box-containing protein